MRLISKSVPKVAEKVFQKKYVMLGRLVTQWDDIMGKDMAAKTQPVKLKFRKTPDKSKQFTLEIACNSAEATMLQYRVDLILEKLSMIVGAGVVTAIRFVPVTSNTARPAITRPNKKILDSNDENFLRKTLENVEDPDIQEKLKNLGASLLQDRKNKTRD